MKGKRLPRRDCRACGGSGWIPHPKGVVKCGCWRYVEFGKKKSAVADGKARSVGSE